ncbi:VanZ family protein [Haloarcula salinisoli]|uniref:VanZ family protein n=1 Tax=Haloarcula salinisoli TaxID=2487746 RepID=A0A8J7YHB6_9EURY|nr:VanZ family protein [Halomicroarcula salinisoli]MBX0288284.1 VanZ family protein [Halomicroarcula salinisoli]MBX0305945.1 VanZ family protein [Halomicroarcula salinisoli]
MPSQEATADARWRRVLTVGVVLLVGSLVPSPFDRHEAFDTYGPDKWLHFVGHVAFAVTLADAFAADGTANPISGGGALCGSVLLGLAVGYLQQYVPGRVPERADLVAGVLGSMLGVGWWYRSTE